MLVPGRPGAAVVDRPVAVVIQTVVADLRTARGETDRSGTAVVDEPVAVVVQPVAADFGRDGSAGTTGIQQELVNRAVAVVVQAVAGLGRTRDLAGADAPATAAAGGGTTDASAHVRPAGLGGAVDAGASFVDVAVAVVVDRVAGFGSSRPDVADADAPVEAVGAGLETARAGSEVRSANSGCPGSADAVLVHAAVAVLVEQVAADFGRGTDETDASAPTAHDASLGSAGAFARVVAAGLGRAVHARTALIHVTVAVVVEGVTGLGGRSRVAHAAAVGPLAGSEAVVQTGPGTHDALAEVGAARFGRTNGAGAPFVNRTVAVVVQAVAGLGGGRSARTGRPEPTNAGLDAHRARTHVRAAGTGIAAATLAAFVNRGVAVVVHAVAGLGGRSRAEAQAPVAAHAPLDTSGTRSDVGAANARMAVRTLAVFVNGPVAVVVRAVAVLRGYRTARAASIEQSFVDPAVAVVVEPVAGFGRREVQGLARTVARAVVQAEHPALGASAEESRDDAVDGKARGTAGAVLVDSSVAVVVDAVAADFRILVRSSRRLANVGVTRTVRETPHLADRASAGNESVAVDEVTQRANSLAAHAAFIGFAVAVVVHAIADLGTRVRTGRRPFAVTGLVTAHAQWAVDERVADQPTLAEETLPCHAVVVRLALGPRVHDARIAAAEARDAEHGTHAEHQEPDPVRPVPHVHAPHLPFPPCAAVPHAAEPPPSSEQPISSRALRRENSSDATRVKERLPKFLIVNEQQFLTFYFSSVSQQERGFLSPLSVKNRTL